MAEATTLKRLREETQIYPLQEVEESQKRHKASYNQILSLLEEDEEEPSEDLSSLITSLQQEISSSSSSSSTPILQTAESDPNPNPNISLFQVSSEDEDDKERVIRHLLEASDDELGIPNTEFDLQNDAVINGGEFGFCDGLWEFEDETANYYTLLQSELFL